jgi:stage IV sporulation protein FB
MIFANKDLPLWLTFLRSKIPTYLVSEQEMEKNAPSIIKGLVKRNPDDTIENLSEVMEALGCYLPGEGTIILCPNRIRKVAKDLGIDSNILFCIVYVHELAHAAMAYRRGYKLNKIRLMPHGVSISGNNVYFSYRDEIMIAIAGPLSNFVLAVVVMALWWIFPITYVYTFDFFVANLAIGVVNLLPVYPLDGGRVLLALLSQRISRLKAVKILKILGVIISVALVIAFVVSTFFVPNYTVLIFGAFLLVTTLTDTRSSQYLRVNNLEYKMSRINKGIALKNIAVNQDITLYKLFSQVTPFAITNFTVLDDQLKVVGEISEKQLNHLVTIYPATAKIRVILSQMLV